MLGVADADVLQAREEAFDGNAPFGPREGSASASVKPATEGDVGAPVLPIDVEASGILELAAVTVHAQRVEHDVLTRLEIVAADGDRLARGAPNWPSHSSLCRMSLRPIPQRRKSAATPR